MKKLFIDDEIRRTVKVLQAGGVILYPTDTIWGIGCLATDNEAVMRIQGIKKREPGKGLLVLVSSEEMLRKYVSGIPDTILSWIRHEKKPTTLIFQEVSGLAPALFPPDKTLGIRLTQDPFCCKLIDEAGIPLVSTSANYAGELPPKGFSEIHPGIIREADYVVNYRQDEISSGIPSRIIRLHQDGSIEVIRE